MYPKYFGLKEASFSITPDPHYLFLSEQHREAVAHLLYGAGDSGGFVLLTGEVGTGKTTVCRAFLEQLPPDVDVALVLNPALTAVELLHAICNEFGVDVPQAEQSSKALVDRLNQFLLDVHARGRRPVLIIDEAQNLRPKVMEQIRLLTNLETTKHKLLQIFLIGQPELRAMLASPDLRQLNQRITARFHLKPLNARETAAYIDHRITVAGVDRPLFTDAALRRVYRLTGGIPRLINLLCDRALLGAAVSRRMQVTPEIVARAAREVNGSDDGALPRRGAGLAVALSILLAVLTGIWIGGTGIVQTLPERFAVWRNDSPEPAIQLDEPRSVAMPAAADPDDLLADALAAEQVQLDAAGAQSAEVLAAEQVQLDAAGEQSAEVLAAEQAQLDAVGEQSAEGLAAVQETALAQNGPEALASIAAQEGQKSEPDLRPSLLESAEDIASSEPAMASSEATIASYTPRIPTARAAPEMEELDADGLPQALLADNAVVYELIRLWGVATDAVVSGLDCRAVAAFGLDCMRSNGRWSELRRFDRPAALQLTLADGRSGQVVISRIDDEHAILDHGGRLLRVPIAVLDERWSGDYLLLWRLPLPGATVIGRGSGRQAVAWLREQLASLPDSTLSAKPARYDAQMIDAIKRFQSEQGLSVDGVVGPRTLILLSNARSVPDVPRLTQSR